MTVNLTINEMIEQVRSQIDEDNITSVGDPDILASLNRAQKFAANILARHYEEPLLKYTTLTLQGGKAEYPIPQDVFEDRVEKIEISTFQGTQTEVKRISYRDLSDYESNVRSTVPAAYVVIGKKIRFVSPPTGQYNARVWYLQRPTTLTKSQGRITIVNPTSNYIIVDDVGPDLTTEQDQLGAFVNIVDSDTGEIKFTGQIKTLNDNKITFKSVPNRTSIAGRTIQSDINALTDTNGDPLTIDQDDLVCLATGTCIPFMQDPLTNFMVEYAIAEMTRKTGGTESLVRDTLAKFEQQVEHSWVGREQTRRIKKRNRHFHTRHRRWPTTSTNGN